MKKILKKIFCKKRKYKNLPNPNTQIEEFNEYLRKNNELIRETKNWILIKNSFIPNQLVLFNKNNLKYLSEISIDEFVELKFILKDYDEKKFYVNAAKDKSVPNRLHIHICMF